MTQLRNGSLSMNSGLMVIVVQISIEPHREKHLIAVPRWSVPIRNIS